jgi:hypothetical protein
MSSTTTPHEMLTSTFDETEAGPCDVAPSRSLGGALDALTAELSAGESAMALLALSEHAGALRLVWEAHVRGAITLPPSVARRVVQARRTVPPFLSRDDIVGETAAATASATATVVVLPGTPLMR